jgi:hypothetical protein
MRSSTDVSSEQRNLATRVRGRLGEKKDAALVKHGSGPLSLVKHGSGPLTLGQTCSMHQRQQQHVV